MSVIDLPSIGADDSASTTLFGRSLSRDQPCKLIQLSDLHLQQHPVQRYRGFDVEQQLRSVFEHIRCHHADLDGLLLTGDLVDHGHVDGYRRLVGYLEQLGKPWCWIAGNHDSLIQMQSYRSTPPPGFDCNGWRVVMLDSCSEPDGMGRGSLAESELQRLARELNVAETHGQPMLLVLHHNPIPVDSRWQDVIMLGNADRLWSLLARYSLSITVLSGHIHQTYDQHYQGVRLLSCPSTAVQFQAQQAQLLLETDPLLAGPGYRWLMLPPVHANGLSTEVDQKNANRVALDTGIERVSLA